MKRLPTLLLAVCLFFPAFGVALAAAPDANVKTACEKVMPFFVEHLKNLVSMDSGTDDIDELNQKKEYLVKTLAETGAEVTTLDATGKRSGTSNIIARIKGTGKAKIMLVAHYDTVWPKGEAAKRPFRIENNTAYGPGVSDEQHSIAGVLAVFDLLRTLGYRDFEVITAVLNADEEKSSTGSRDLIMQEAAGHDVVFSLEGGGDEGDTLYISCRGIAYAQIEVQGVAAHSGENPTAGHNAGVELARQILNMLDLGDEAKGTDAHWTVGSFGIKANMIPGNATATLNVRTKLNAEMDRVEAAMRERIQTVADKGCTVTLEFRRGRPPFEPNEKTDLLAEKAQAIYAQELGKTLRLLHMGGASDANFAYQKAPVLEGLGMGGGDWHALTEFLPLGNVPDRLYLLVRMIQETCKGNTVPIGTASR